MLLIGENTVWFGGYAVERGKYGVFWDVPMNQGIYAVVWGCAGEWGIYAVVLGRVYRTSQSLYITMLLSQKMKGGMNYEENNIFSGSVHYNFLRCYFRKC